MSSKLLLALVSVLILGGCSLDHPPLLETKFIALAPPSALFMCPDMKPEDYPTGVYSQSDVAVLLAKLQQRGDICKASLTALQAYLDETKKQIEAQK